MQTPQLIFDWLTRNVVGVESQWFWTMVQAVVVTVTLIFIARQVRHQSHSNMLSLLQSFHVRWDSIDSIKGRVRACEQFLENDKDVSDRHVVLLLHFFEELGLFHREGLIKTHMLWSMYNDRVTNYWCILEPMITEYRAHNDDNSYYEEFENMMRSMERFSKKRGLKSGVKTEKLKRKYAETHLVILRKVLAQASADDD